MHYLKQQRLIQTGSKRKENQTASLKKPVRPDAEKKKQFITLKKGENWKTFRSRGAEKASV